VPGAGLQQVKGLARVRILLGSNNHTVSAPTTSTPSTPSTPSQSASPVQQRTAAQDACSS
jgi:hypothetical protein